MNGQKLRTWRESQGVRQADVGREMEVGRSRTSAIEASEDVSDSVAERYLNAIERVVARREGRTAYEIVFRLDVDVYGPPGSRAVRRALLKAIG